MKTGKKKAVIIYSGGLDSTVLLHELNRVYGPKNVLALTFNYQSKHNKEETKMAKKNCKHLGIEHRVINISQISKHLKSNLLLKGGKIPRGHYEEATMKKTVVPFRNGIMLSIACGIAESFGAKTVAIANHAGDHAVYPDCRATFIEAMNEAMAYGTYEGVNILSHFKNSSKAEIVCYGKGLNVKFENTYSCYEGAKIQCGECSTCFERREAFALAGVKDLTVYSSKKTFEQLNKKYSKRVKNG